MTKTKALVIFVSSLILGVSIAIACETASDVLEKDLTSPPVALAPSGGDQQAAPANTSGTLPAAGAQPQ